MSEFNHGEESIAFAVGGTGGHVLPSLDIARNLPGEGKRILIGVGISENPFVLNKEFKRFNVLGNNFSSGFFSGVISILKGAKQATQILRKQKCNHVIGMGGFHSVPVILAAFYLRIPVTLYEPNLIPGKVNKFFSLFAKRTLVLFDEAGKHLFGPTKLLRLSLKQDATKHLPSVKLLRKEFGLEENVTTVLIFGGSRGARSINNLVDDTLKYINVPIQVIHLTGLKHGIEEVYKEHGIKAFVVTFFKDMDRAWKACDFAICRAGAGTIKEALIHKTPVMLIPYPHAVNNHQNFNALFMQNSVKAGKLLSQNKITNTKLAAIIEEFSCSLKRGDMIKNIEDYMNLRKGESIDDILL